ncbi:serine/threonine-protein kinase AtPK2/AtPK19-like [Centruroides sculpturatus]|uniref:serine/threonine-protein kinase AtPK2/AtPK19-like n=1 Tax=Centruroides sculpturatus TaxID=218467 RepID=UPI000C6ED0DF|nr:serine/threonine-protein kinase AtPK2/AtPK19-like [Centruroides sculpturatus]
MEYKPWDYFMDLDYNKSSEKAVKQALKTCADPSDRIKNPACVLSYIPKTAMADDICNFKGAMKQLAAYMLSLNNRKAFGILTTYCHTYFAILEHPGKGRPTLKVSRAVRYSENDVLERVFKFIELAVRTPAVEMKDKNDSTNVSPVQIGKRNAGQCQTKASFKKGDRTKRLKGNKDSKNGNSGSSPKKRATYGDYIIDGIIGEGRSGCVLRLVDRNGCSFAAKTIGEFKYKTKMERKEIISELQNEIEIYEALKDLQGRVLPRLHFEAYLDRTRYSLIMDGLDADPLWTGHPTEDQKRAILAVLHQIHERGILHGDIRKENILLDRKDKKRVYFIDFALSSVCDVQKEFQGEMEELRSLLEMDQEPKSFKTLHKHKKNKE